MKVPQFFLCAVLCVSQLFSQSYSHKYLDFEDATEVDSVLVFGNYHLDGMQHMIVANPNKNHINKSDQVINYTKSRNATLEAGFSIEIDELYLPEEPYQVCFDYYAPTIGLCRFQMRNMERNTNATMITSNKKVSQWETICATVINNTPKDIIGPPQKLTNRTFVLYPDDQSWGSGEDQEFYFDNLRIYLGSFSRAVNFKVDMNGYEEEYEHVFVSGSFNNWSGNADTLYDTDLDGIWELEKRMFDHDIEYVYSIDGWRDNEYFSGNELCIASHADGQGGYYRNRVASIDKRELPLVCFGSCYSCDGAADITWNLNMNHEAVSPEGVFLAGGDHFGHGKYEMKDEDEDGIYSITMERHLGFSSNYTFINGLCDGGWGCKENIVGQACADDSHYSDRFLAPLSKDIQLDACFGYCSSEGLCEVEQVYSVTFNLDARDLDRSIPLYLAGKTINAWAPRKNPLLDNDDDGIYSTTVSLSSGQHLYKFVHGDVWEDLSDETDCTITDPSGVYTNRYVIVEDEDVIVDVVLFEECNGYVSTEEVVSSGLSVDVFPTVTPDIININFLGKHHTSLVRVYNMNGGLMSEQSLDMSYNHQLDVSSYDAGSYFITFYNGESYKNTRFIKI